MPSTRPTPSPWPITGMPRRYAVVLMCGLATFACYIDRVAMSIAVLPMADSQGWSPSTRGVVLSSFFFGYAAAMVPAGWLVARLGGRRVIDIGLMIWAGLTLLTPLAGLTSLVALIGVRALLGAAQAMSFPAALNLFARWLPPTERSRAAAINLAGIPLGSVFALSTAGWLVGRFGWPSVFWIYGTAGAFLAAAWPRIVPQAPTRGAAHLMEGDRSAPVPWRELLRHRAVWALIANHFSVNWTLYMMLTWLPSYYRDAHHLSLESSGLFSIAPWLCQFATSMSAGIIADRRITAGVRVTRVRTQMQCTGLLGSAVALVLASQASSTGSALVTTCLALGFSGITWAGFAVNHLDIAPGRADILWGLTNTAGSIPGIVGVAVTGFLLEQTGGYTAAFLLAAIVSVAGAVIWLAWSSGDEIALSRRAQPVVDRAA